MNGILTHFFKRCSRQPEEMRYITHIALPKVLRLDALKQYHDSLAGGGHLGIVKGTCFLDTAILLHVATCTYASRHSGLCQILFQMSICQKELQSCEATMQPMPARERFEC